MFDTSSVALKKEQILTEFKVFFKFLRGLKYFWSLTGLLRIFGIVKLGKAKPVLCADFPGWKDEQSRGEDFYG